MYGIELPIRAPKAQLYGAHFSLHNRAGTFASICINLSSLSELPRLHNSLAIAVDRSILDHTLSSDVSSTVSSCCGVSYIIAYMSSPTIVNINTTTTVAATATTTTVATTTAAK